MTNDTMSRSVAFFYMHAGYSQRLDETREEGRQRCARELAAAELLGREAGMSFAWSVDPDIDSSDFSDEQPPWQQWEVLAYDEHGEVVGSLGGVDFGRDGTPWSHPYRRVVEAELAEEYLP